MQEKFQIVYLSDADNFIASLPLKARAKILYNIKKSKFCSDPKLLKKLDGTDIWEFRTKFAGVQYRLLAFWDDRNETLVVATHGFVKKTQKTPKQEIERAEYLRSQYFKQNGKNENIHGRRNAG